MNHSRLIQQIASEDARILDAEILAPRMPHQKINVKIAGVTIQLAIAPQNFSGFGIFKPLSYRYGRLLRPATVEERERYLRMLPAVRMLVAGRDNVGFQGCVQSEDSRFAFGGGIARINLAEGVELFDTVVCRFDGGQFWFDGPDSSRRPMIAEAMRQALSEGAACPELGGLIPSERWLYDIVLKASREAQEAARLDAEAARRNTTEGRLQDALRHAGATMRSYIERQDGFAVEWATKDGERHSTFVDKNLRVQSAGICLSGGDADYDLSSLVGVVAEGREKNAIVRMGINREHDDDD